MTAVDSAEIAKREYQRVGRMRVDVDLLPLPLLPLAAAANVRLVARMDLPAPCGGGVFLPFNDKEGNVIALDPATIMDGHTIDTVFAHEVAHALDPAFVGDGNAAVDRREHFANRLGPLLLDTQPQSLDEVWPILGRVAFEVRL